MLNIHNIIKYMPAYAYNKFSEYFCNKIVYYDRYERNYTICTNI